MHDDSTLYRRWRDAQDEGAFAEIARRHADLVVDVARCVAGDRMTAEDALQQALLRLALERSDRPAAVGVRAWLAAAALGVARNARTAERRRAVRERASSERRTSVERSPTTEDGLDAWLAGLDGEERALLRLRYAYGLDTDELAEVYGAHSGTVRVRLHRALERLRADAPPKRARALLVASLGARGLGVSQAVVQSATRGALAAASGATIPGTVGLVASRAAPWSVPALWTAAAALLALIGAGAWWIGAGERRSGAPSVEVRTAHTPGELDRPMLAGRAPGERATSSPRATPDDTPIPSPAAAKSDRTPGPPRATVSGDPAPEVRLPTTRVRLLLASTDEALTIWRATWEGREYVVDAVAPFVPVRPGACLVLTTKDPRSAFTFVSTRVPDPVPAEIVLRTAARADPRLETVTLRVVDAETRAPLPRAYLDLGREVVGDGAVIRADAEGRIRIGREVVNRLPGGPYGAVPVALLANGIFEEDHEPEYRETAGLGVSEEHLASWLERGEIAIERKAYPEGGEAVDLRLLRPSGLPAAGLYVECLFPNMWPLPGAVRRTDSDGRLHWKRAPDMMGLVVHDQGICVHGWVLSRGVSRRLGTRTLTVPALATVDLEVNGFPLGPAGGRRGHCWLEFEVLDGMDKAGTPEAPTYFRNNVLQPPAALITEQHSLYGYAEVVSTEPPVLRWRLPPERACRLLLSPAEGEARSLDVTPAEGTQRLVRRWEDLAPVR